MGAFFNPILIGLHAPKNCSGRSMLARNLVWTIWRWWLLVGFPANQQSEYDKLFTATRVPQRRESMSNKSPGWFGWRWKNILEWLTQLLEWTNSFKKVNSGLSSLDDIQPRPEWSSLQKYRTSTLFWIHQIRLRWKQYCCKQSWWFELPKYRRSGL